MKLANLFSCKPPQIQSGVEVPVNDQATDLTLIRAMLERHALFDLPTARTALGGRKPARGDEELSPCTGNFGLEELQELPHRRICHGTRQLAVGHHAQDVEIFHANHPTGPREFRRERVLNIPTNGGNLLMLACHLAPLFLIVLAEHGPLGFGVFRFLLF